MILCQVKFSGLAWTQELKEELCDIMELCTIFRYSFICRSAHACSLLGVSTFGACARSDWEESSRVTDARAIPSLHLHRSDVYHHDWFVFDDILEVLVEVC